jgi:mycothiol synthase
MTPAMRRYQDEEDYGRIRSFLQQVFLLNGRRELSWPVARFDYWRWHGIENLGDGRLEEDVFIWETADGQMAAVLNRESAGAAFLQVHPARRTPELEAEMLEVAERHLAISRPGGRRKLWVMAMEGDRVRREVLMRRGYTRQAPVGCDHRRPMSGPIPDVPLAAGYSIRSLSGPEDLPARSWVSWRAFHPEAPAEEYNGWEWYRNVQRAPLYRQELDLVAVAPDGAFASFCTIWYDEVTGTAYYEPVGTAPEHQRRGLGRAVMMEGLRRLKDLGAVLAAVGSAAPHARAFYNSIGFVESDLARPWEKEL